MPTRYLANILKEEAYHLCFVVNSGGFEGIITMHDILENSWALFLMNGVA